MSLLILISKILGTCVLAAICGILFRFGGSSNIGARWLRQIGVEFTELGGLWLWFGWSWWMVLITGLAWTESTYFKSKGTEAKWWNWLLCGLQYSLIPLPLVFLHVIHWQGFLVRLAVLTPIITLWRTLQGDVDWSEGGAGAWQILTLPLLSIG